MNKKLLSTVLAGGMLATTVVPAMATWTVHEYQPEEYEVSDKNKDTLVEEIIKIMESKQLTTGGKS